MPSSTIQRGNVLYTTILQTTLTPASVVTVTTAEQTFTVRGLQVGDQISAVSLQAAWTGLTSIVGFRVSAADTLAISFQNGTAGSLTPPAGTYMIEVNRAETTLPSNNA